MIEIKLAISICVAVFFFGLLVGGTIMAISASKGYDDAVSDAFYSGYEQGKREEECERTEKAAI